MLKLLVPALLLTSVSTALASWPNEVYKCREFIQGSNEQIDYHKFPELYFDRLLSTRFFPQEMLRPHDQSLFLTPSERSGGQYAQIDFGNILTSLFKSKNQADSWGYTDTSDNASYFRLKKDISSTGGPADEIHSTNVMKSVFSFDPESMLLNRGIVSPKNVKISYFNFRNHAGAEVEEDVIIKGLLHAYNSNKNGPKISVLNMSLRSDYIKYACQSEKVSAVPGSQEFQKLGIAEKLSTMFKALADQDITTIVFSAGNNTKNISVKDKLIEDYFGNCKYSNWLMVANLERDSREVLATSSNRGQMQDLASIGTNVAFEDHSMSTTAPGEFGNDNVGTSFSAPHVSGTVLTLSRVNPALKSSEIKLILALTSSGVVKAPEFGKGMPNLVLSTMVARDLKGKVVTPASVKASLARFTATDLVEKKLQSLKRPVSCEAYPKYYDQLLLNFLQSGRKNQSARHELCRLYNDLLLVGPKLFLGCHDFSDTRVSLNDIRYFNEQIQWGHVPSYKTLTKGEFTPAPVKVKEISFESYNRPY